MITKTLLIGLLSEIFIGKIIIAANRWMEEKMRRKVAMIIGK